MAGLITKLQQLAGLNTQQTVTVNHGNETAHTIEFPLIITEADRNTLEKRFNAARAIYNASLAECLARLSAMRSDPNHKVSAMLPSGKRKTQAFKDLCSQYSFGQAAIESFARTVRDACWIKDHMGGHDTQTTATRAFKAVQRWSFHKAGKPRFQTAKEFRSIASKDACSLIQLRTDNYGRKFIAFRGLKIRLRRKTYSPAELHSLALPIALLRIIQHTDTARIRYAVQIVVKGSAFQHRQTNPGHVGIDIGPSTIAVVSTTDSSVERFCPEVMHPWKAIRTLQRKLDRSRRANNPNCFKSDGSFIKGKRPTNKSKIYQRTLRSHARRQRKLARQRANAHGNLVNRILGSGTIIHAEKLSHVAFQKMFGRSASVRASGAFMAKIKVKAESAGGCIIDINTRTTKLSQYDHTTQDYVKKPLSLRIHQIRDGSATVQRDLYSAFLALHCDKTQINQIRAEQAWPGACEHLAVVAPATKPARRAAVFPLPPAAHKATAEPVAAKSRSTRHRAIPKSVKQGRSASSQPKINRMTISPLGLINVESS